MASEIHQKLVIGPPNTRFMGLNNTLRRQQINPNEFWKLHGLRLQGEALQRITGNVRLASGALPAKSLSLDGAANCYVNIPLSVDSVTIDDYDLGRNWTIFCSYTPDDLTDGLELEFTRPPDGPVRNIRS